MTLKKLGWTLLALAVTLVALVVIAYHVALSSYAVRNWYLPPAVAASGAQIEFGECQLSLFSDPMIEIRDLKVRKPGEINLTLDHLRADLTLTALRDNCVAIPELRLKNLQLQLQLPESEAAKIATSGSSEKSSRLAERETVSAPTKTVSAASPWRFQIGVIDIADVNVAVTTGKKKLLLTGGSLKLQNFAPGKTFAAELAARLQVQTPELEIERSQLKLQLQSTPELRNFKCQSQGQIELKYQEPIRFNLAIQAERPNDKLVNLERTEFQLTTVSGKKLVQADLHGRADYQNFTAQLSGKIAGGNLPVLDQMLSKYFQEPVRNFSFSGEIDFDSAEKTGALHSRGALAVQGDNLPLSPWRGNYHLTGKFDVPQRSFQLDKLGVRLQLKSGWTQLDLLQTLRGTWPREAELPQLGAARVRLQASAQLKNILRDLKLKTCPVTGQRVELDSQLYWAQFPGAVALDLGLSAQGLQLKSGNNWGIPAHWKLQSKSQWDEKFQQVKISQLDLAVSALRTTSAVQVQGALGLQAGGPSLPLHVKWQIPDAGILSLYPVPEMVDWQVEALQSAGKIQAVLPPLPELLTRWNQVQLQMTGQVRSPKFPVSEVAGQLQGHARWNLAEKRAEVELLKLNCQDGKKYFNLALLQDKKMQLEWRKKFWVRNAHLQLNAQKFDLPVLMKLLKQSTPIQRGELTLDLGLSGNWPGNFAGHLQGQLDDLKLTSSPRRSNWRLGVKASSSSKFAELGVEELQLSGTSDGKSIARVQGTGRWPLNEHAPTPGQISLAVNEVGARTLECLGCYELSKYHIQNFNLSSLVKLQRRPTSGELTGNFSLRQLQLQGYPLPLDSNLLLTLRQQGKKWVLPQLSWDLTSGSRQLADVKIQGHYDAAHPAPLDVQLESQRLDAEALQKIVQIVVPDTAPQPEPGEITPPFSPTAPPNRAAQKIQASTAPVLPPAAWNLAPLNGKLKINLHQIGYTPQLRASCTGQLLVRQNRVQIAPLAIRLNGAPVALQGEMDFGSTAGYPYQFNWSVDRLVLDPLGQVIPDLERVKGQISFRSQLSGVFYPGHPSMITSLVGRSFLQVWQIEFPAESAQALKLVDLVFLPVELLLKGTDRVKQAKFIPELNSFRSTVSGILSGEQNFVLNDGIGRFEVGNSTLYIPVLEFTGGTIKKEMLKGYINLLTGNMKLQTEVHFMKLIFPLTIEGTLQNPQPNYSNFLLLFTGENLLNLLNPENVVETGKSVQDLFNLFRSKKHRKK